MIKDLSLNIGAVIYFLDKRITNIHCTSKYGLLLIILNVLAEIYADNLVVHNDYNLDLNMIL